MNILFVIQGLSTGGAEKNLTLLANAAKIAGHSVTIVTLDNNEGGSRFKLEPGMTISPLGLTTKNRSILSKLLILAWLPSALRRLILKSKPEVVIAFMDQANILTLWALRNAGIPVVACERTNPERASLLEQSSSKNLRGIVKKIRNAMYRKAARIVTQTERAKGTLPADLHSRISVIPNPVFPPEKAIDESNRQDIILGVGRLSREKRFDILLEAFARIAPEFPAWELHIAGDGPLKSELVALSEKLNLSNKLKLLGARPSLHSTYESASIFVLCSDYEGFPTALAESMSYGLAAVATDCEFGPRELISNQVDGILVPCNDPAAVATALRGLIMDGEHRARIGRNAREISRRFAPAEVFKQWLDLFTQVKTDPRP